MSRLLRIIVVSLVALTISATLAWAATYGTYRVNVKRIAQDLYQDTSSRAIIKTRYCYVYTYGEDAILEWQGKYNSWIIFTGVGQRCDVDGVY